jgi:hypothetical protein
MTEENIQHSEIMKGLGKLEGLYTGIISRMDIANGRTSKNEIKIEALEKAVEKLIVKTDSLKEHDGEGEKAAQQRKNWLWGAIEKIIFIIIGFAFTVIGFVLTKLGIINLGS